MSNTQDSPFEINAQEPDHFDQKSFKKIDLEFEGFAEKPRFGFKAVTVASAVPVDVKADLDRLPMQFFQSLDDFREAFYENIEIHDDTLIEVETKGEHFFWSKKIDAIMTKHSRKRLYGDLLYWSRKGQKWRERETHPDSTCTLISFKAKYNDGIDGENRHKFSYNVRVRNKNDHMVEYEIDPDIQNPRTKKRSHDG
jgi:hypothetical protein